MRMVMDPDHPEYSNDDRTWYSNEKRTWNLVCEHPLLGQECESFVPCGQCGACQCCGATEDEHGEDGDGEE